MAKKIAIISYNTDPGSTSNANAIVFRDTVKKAGYSANLVHQWCLNEPNASTFKSKAQWEEYAGIVIDGYPYKGWNLREVILSGLPVICANSGYVDDLGLGIPVEDSISEDDFSVVNNSHLITAGFSSGSLDIGAPVSLAPVSPGNHHVDVLITTLANEAVLVAHKTHPLVYFGWWGMSKASAKSPLFKLLTNAAKWAFN